MKFTRYNFSQMIKEISFADLTGENFFINFTRNRSIHFQRNEFLGWKSEFVNSNLLGYWPEINMGVAYFNNIVRLVVWNNGFRTRKKFEFGFVGRGGVHLSRDGKVMSIISKNRVKMIETNTLRDLARLNLNEFIKADRAVLITSLNFFDDFTFGLVTVQGHVVVMHYPSGTVFFTHEPEVANNPRKSRTSLRILCSMGCSL